MFYSLYSHEKHFMATSLQVEANDHTFLYSHVYGYGYFPKNNSKAKLIIMVLRANKKSHIFSENTYLYGFKAIYFLLYHLILSSRSTAST